MRYSSLFLILFVAALSTHSPSVATAAIISVTSMQDTSIYQEAPGRSNGAGQAIFVGRTVGTGGTTIRRALLKFDVAGSVPAGATINSVTLTLSKVIYGPNAGADVLELRPLTNAWGEGTSFGVGKGAPATTGDATWNRRSFNTLSWTTPGGDFGPVAGNLTLDGTSSVDIVPSQAGMVSNVQSWLNNPATNFGWLLKYADENASGTARAYASRESGFVNQRPLLTIDYSLAIPEPHSALLIGVASMLFARFRSSRRQS